MADAAEELESSTSPETQDVEEPSSGSDVEHSSMEDAIRSVVGDPVEDAYEPEPAEEEPTDSSPEGEETGSPAGDTGDDTPPETAEDDDDSFIQMLRDKEVPLGKIERFQELISERNGLRAERDELNKVQVQLNELTEHARRAGLDDEQMANWYSMPAILANDPAKAYELIQGFMGDLAQRMGHELPEDLQKKVDEGYLDQESAQELAQSRAQLGEERRLSEYDESQRQQQRAQDARGAIVTAVNTRQSHYQKNDPDYSPQKHRLVQNELAALVRQEGMPKTPEDAAALADKAHQNVSETLGQLQPKRKPAKTISGRSSTRSVATEPKSMLEAISNALNNTD